MQKLTIHEALAAKLGREPTNAELRTGWERILTEAMQERAAKGTLVHQR
jgi:hypothetical protein